MNKLNFYLVIIITLSITTQSFASDHIDGPVTRKNRVSDITDLYAFPSPTNSQKLILILNTYPFVGKNGHFSEKVEYDFLLKQASRVNHKIKLQESQTITCSFITPHNHTKKASSHMVTCKSRNGLSASAKFNTLDKQQANNDFKIYAGKRSDPFFINTDYAKALVSGKIPKGKFKDGSSKLNVLSIVLELDINKLFKDKSDLYVVAAQSTTKSNKNGKKRILDRVGRAEITNITLSSKNKIELRDLYNIEDTFKVSSKYKEQYANRLSERVEHFDKLDEEKFDWDQQSRKELVGILIDDYLILDITKPCLSPGFLEIEKSLIAKEEHQSCGGRKLTDDIVDIIYTYYINRDRGEIIGDDAHGPHKKPNILFPYLRKPTTGYAARVKAFLANKLKF